MKTFALLAAAFLFGSLASMSGADAATSKFYDPVTRGWVEYESTMSAREPTAQAPAPRQRSQQVSRAPAPAQSTRNPIPRETVDYNGPYGANTIVINTSERRLYYVLGNGKALKFGVGVGREGFQWSGTHRITRKAEWPGWTPPAAMRKRQPNLPAYMPGGPSNPLGARALYIGSTLYRIHGSNEPWTIGQAVSSGCIRMVNEDVIDLYEMVDVGTKVVVTR